jgi:hypothetical protein
MSTVATMPKPLHSTGWIENIARFQVCSFIALIAIQVATGQVIASCTAHCTQWQTRMEKKKTLQVQTPLAMKRGDKEQ